MLNKHGAKKYPLDVPEAMGPKKIVLARIGGEQKPGGADQRRKKERVPGGRLRRRPDLWF